MSYAFYDFHERFNQWVDDNEPPDDFKFWVMAWLLTLQSNPTVHAARANELGEDWWFAKVPNADDDDRAVVCLYSIIGEVVRCSGFTTLSKPII